MESLYVIFGKPGAGKGTRKNEFLKGREDEYSILGVSALLKKKRAADPKFDKTVKSYMDQGLLVPDDIIIGLVAEFLNESDKPVLADGFPRTVGQAQAMLDAGINPIVVDLDVPNEDIIERAKYRIVCEPCDLSYTTNAFNPPKVAGVCNKCGGPLTRRADDDPETVATRLQEYESKTYPVLDFLRNAGVTVHTVDNTTEEPDLLAKYFL